MKKALVGLVIYGTLMLPSFAVMTSQDSTSDAYLKNHGYSDETIRIINLQHSQINGIPDTTQNNDPAWYSFFPVKWVRRAFIYLDGGLDDGKFGKGNIKFTPIDSI